MKGKERATCPHPRLQGAYPHSFIHSSSTATSCSKRTDNNQRGYVVRAHFDRTDSIQFKSVFEGGTYIVARIGSKGSGLRRQKVPRASPLSLLPPSLQLLSRRHRRVHPRERRHTLPPYDRMVTVLGLVDSKGHTVTGSSLSYYCGARSDWVGPLKSTSASI